MPSKPFHPTLPSKKATIETRVDEGEGIAPTHGCLVEAWFVHFDHFDTVDGPTPAPLKQWNTNGCGSQLNRRGYAGSGPCFHLPRFHFGIPVF